MRSMENQPEAPTIASDARTRRIAPWLAAAVLTVLPFAGSSAQDASANDGAEARFSVAKVYAELNHSDGDLGFHALIDGDGWERLEIEGPDERTLLAVSNDGSLRMQGLTELFFESAEPTFDELSPAAFFARFPEGAYEIEGRAVGGHKLESVAQFTHIMPAPPANISVSGMPVPANCESDDGPSIVGPVVIRWDPVQNSHPEVGTANADIEIAGYQVVVVDEDLAHSSLSVDLPPSITELQIPEGFFGGPSQLKFEILALEASGNQTAVESCFSVEGA